MDVRFCYSGDLDSVVSILDMLTPSAVLVSVNESHLLLLLLYRSDEMSTTVQIVVIQNAGTLPVSLRSFPVL